MAELERDDEKLDELDDQALEDDLEPDELPLDDDLEPDEPELDDQEEGGERVWIGLEPSAPITAMPGCAVSFFADNKRHHGVCLAVIGEEVLLEQKGASQWFLFTGKIAEIVPRLRRGVASATIVVAGIKPCRYRSVPKKWLLQLVRTGQTWKGIERGGSVAQSPTELLDAMKDGGQLELF